MNACNVLMSVLVLLLMPTCAGYAVCGYLRLPRSITACFLGGTFAQWALLQFISIPMTLLKLDFRLLVWLYMAGFGVLCLVGTAGFIRNRKSAGAGWARLSGEKWKVEDVVALLALIAGYAYLAYNCAVFRHVDLDDARFVVTAVDIENTNRLFLTDYGTGKAMTVFAGPMRHDLFSPWAVYVALVARLTATPVAITAHSVLPQGLILCALSAWLLLAQQLFGNRRFEKYGATLLILLLTMYSKNTSYTAESFFLRRLWQGKSVVASVGIPVLYLVLTACAEDTAGFRPYLPIYITALAMCLISAMGIIFCCILCGAFGLARGIQTRSVAVALKTWGGVLICVAYVGVMLVLMT